MDVASETKPGGCDLFFERIANDTLRVRVRGSWKIGSVLPSNEEIIRQIEAEERAHRVIFDTRELTGWDSMFLTFLTKLSEECDRKNIVMDLQGLPEGVRRLLALASAVPERKGARKEAMRESFLSRVGTEALTFSRSTVELLGFIGEAALAFTRFLGGKAVFRHSDLGLLMQECGVNALPIVTLITVLVGLILAFIGAVQLRIFGAQIYVASLVGIAMVRVMGAIMTGIIMAGRTGAAYAAELGTMQVNEEIDALKTMGVSPMEFLVLPRMLALMVMMPLLGLYADLMGIIGGLIVGVGMLDINIIEYYNMTKESVNLTNLWIGLFHSAVFGVLVALSGCLRGMQCGRSASAVGEATTSAVVTGIVSIVVATAIITVVCDVIGI